MDHPDKVANPARGQLNRENNIPLSPCVPGNLVSRDGFSRPVPCQPAHLHTQAESGPHLALLARLYHGVETTSCQAEQNVSALALLIGNMLSSMGAFKVEQMMFLRLNQRCIPEIVAYNRVIDRQQARQNQCREDTDKAQNEGGGNLIEIDL